MMRPIDALRTGDAGFYSRLFDRLGAALLRLATGILLDPREAEDVVQEAFLRLHNTVQRGRLVGGEEEAVGLHRTAVRHPAIDHLRRRKVRHGAREVRDNPETAAETTPFAWSEGRELEERLLALMGHLSDLQRAVFLLRALDGATNPEIAEALGIGLEDVKTHLKRARAKLRPLLQDYKDFL